MAIFRKINSDGYYIGDVELHRNIDHERYIEVNWTEGLYKPRWDGEAWVEGMDTAELDKMVAVQELRGKITKANRLIRQSRISWKKEYYYNMLMVAKDGYRTELEGLE